MDAISVAKINSLTRMMRGVNKILDIKAASDIIPGGGEQLLSIPVELGISKFLIKTIHIKARQEGAAPEVFIRTSASTAGFVCYQNGRDGMVIHDVVELAYIDDDNSGKLHLNITNKGLVESTFDVRIIAVSTL